MTISWQKNDSLFNILHSIKNCHYFSQIKFLEHFVLHLFKLEYNSMIKFSVEDKYFDKLIWWEWVNPDPKNIMLSINNNTLTLFIPKTYAIIVT
jgi:hypothetical protein